MNNFQYLIEDELKIYKEMSKVFTNFFIEGKDIFCPPKEFWSKLCLDESDIVSDEDCQNCLCTYVRSIAIENLEKNGIVLKGIYD